MNRALIMVATLSTLALAGCSGDEHSDLKEELNRMTKDLRAKIDPLPVVKPYEPVPYTAFDMADPFGPAKIELVTKNAGSGGGGPKPDLSRPKEPLESFPLESLKMVGVWKKGKDSFALVRADATVYPVKVGNYLGQNFGLVIGVGEQQIELRELVQDSGGDWTERKTTLLLQESEARK